MQFPSWGEIELPVSKDDGNVLSLAKGDAGVGVLVSDAFFGGWGTVVPPPSSVPFRQMVRVRDEGVAVTLF